ncbi:hypothetical protein QO004_003665 [Rhizobium mesoamericanum]|nr:hypothetical protein [Rhizobium mesoamericanum]
MNYQERSLGKTAETSSGGAKWDLRPPGLLTQEPALAASIPRISATRPQGVQHARHNIFADFDVR